MNIVPFPVAAAVEANVPASEIRVAAIETALMAYAARLEAGSLPILNANEQHQQAMRGLQHVSALDPDRGARFVSIHRKVNFADARLPAFPGNAHASLDTAIEDAFYWANKGHDVYWAMGAQARAGERKERAPYPRAERLATNTLVCRCLYSDIDVKAGTYASTREAAGALIAFVRALGFCPTMIVGSGTGGFHVYWRFERAMTPAEFGRRAEALVKAAQAHGLKIDQGCTVDVCRLLRVSGTWNFKGGPSVEGKPVTLIYGGDA